MGLDNAGIIKSNETSYERKVCSSLTIFIVMNETFKIATIK